MNTETLIDEFQSRQATKKAESTAQGYARTARQWADWLENPGKHDYDDNNRGRESKAVFEATTGDLRVWLRYQLQHGLAGGTVRNRRWTLTAFYSELEEMAGEGYGFPQFDNPAEDLDVSDWQALKQGTKKQREMKEVYYLEPSEVDLLAENAPTPSLRNELLIRLLYQTGLRRGELAETRLQDIDTDERYINVHATKTHLNRTVYYQPKLDTLIARWINVERKALSTAGSEYLFPTYKSEKVSPTRLNGVVKQAAEKAGLQADVYTNAAGHNQQKVTAHVLRHSYAVQSLKNGMDTRTLQKLLGHAKIDTTERYLRLAKSDVKESARRYGAGSE